MGDCDPTHRGCGLGRPPTSLATDVQRERLQTMEVRASKMHGSRAVPRDSVTTTHNRLRPSQAQVLPPIKPNQSLSSTAHPLNQPTRSNRPNSLNRPAAHALSLSRTPQAQPSLSPPPPNRWGLLHRGAPTDGARWVAMGSLGHRNGGDPPTPASVGGNGLPGAWAGGGRGRA